MWRAAVLILVLFLGGCGPNVPNPIAVGPGTLALLLDEEGHYRPSMDKPGEVYLTDPRGSFLRRLPGTVNPMGWLRLSPDSSKLLYVSAEEYRRIEGKDYVDVQAWGLRLHNLKTQTESLLVEGRRKISAPSFSPRGARVAYLLEETQTSSWKLHILDLASRKETVLGTEETEQYVWDYRWSSDGEQLLLLRSPPEDSGDQDEECSQLFAELGLWDLTDLDYPEAEGLLSTFSPLQLFLFPGFWPGGGALDWSPAGRWAALVTLAPLFAEEVALSTQLYLVGFDEDLTEVTGMRLLAVDAYSPAFSPRGDRLAFIGGARLDYLSNRGEEGSTEQQWLYLSDVPDGEPRRVAGPGMLSGPFWVAEDELGYIEQVGKDYRIWVLNLATGERFDLSAALAARWGGR